MILADTSVWIDHLRRADSRLVALLQQGRIGMHIMVIGELACGSLKDRDRLLRLWQDLPRMPSVSHENALQFIERHRLMSRGLGYVDVHLLAAVDAQTGGRLWTRDRGLAAVAEVLRLEAAF